MNSHGCVCTSRMLGRLNSTKGAKLTLFCCALGLPRGLGLASLPSHSLYRRVINRSWPIFSSWACWSAVDHVVWCAADRAWV